VKRRLLRFLRLAERPDPPPGAGPSLLTFRASRRYFYLQAAGWGLRQLAALVGIVVSLVFFGFFETTATSLPASRAFDKVAERIFRMSWEELQARVAELWPWVVAVETLAISAFVVGLWLSWTFLRLDWEARWYMVSDECLRIREGLFRTHERTMTVANIQNLSVRRGPLQKLLGIADLESSETRLGIAIRPFAMSAKVQTACSVATEPTITAAPRAPVRRIARAEEVLGRLLAVVRPAEDRREDERQEADGQDDRADVRDVAEGRSVSAAPLSPSCQSPS
jgi:hypothetical protein